MLHHHILAITLFSKAPGVSIRSLFSTIEEAGKPVCDSLISILDCNYTSNPGVIVDAFTEKDCQASNCVLGLHITGSADQVGGMHMVRALPNVLIAGAMAKCKEATGVPVTRIVILPGTSEGEAPPMEMLATAINAENVQREGVNAALEAEFNADEEANADA